MFTAIRNYNQHGGSIGGFEGGRGEPYKKQLVLHIKYIQADTNRYVLSTRLTLHSRNQSAIFLLKAICRNILIFLPHLKRKFRVRES